MGNFTVEEINKQLEDNKKLFEESIKNANQFAKAVQQDVKIVDGSSVQDVAKLKAEVEKLNKALKEKKKSQDNVAKLQEKLNKLNSGALDEEFKLRAEINKTSAELRGRSSGHHRAIGRTGRALGDRGHETVSLGPECGGPGHRGRRAP